MHQPTHPAARRAREARIAAAEARKVQARREAMARVAAAKPRCSVSNLSALD